MRSFRAHLRLCTHGKQHNKVAGSHMQLINESVTAMPLPIPMSIEMWMQGKKLSGFVAAIASLGKAGVLGIRPPSLPPQHSITLSITEQHTINNTICPAICEGLFKRSRR
jgi:hypothetical protein